MALKLPSALAAALAALLLLPASGQANLTIGNDLTLPAGPTASECPIVSPPCTYATTGNHTGNSFAARSPVSGVVQSFGIKTSAPEFVTFRLVHFSSRTATGAGTGPSVNIPHAGITSVPASLPIEAGDYLGIDTSSTTAVSSSCTSGGFYLYHPTLADGGSSPNAANSTCDLLVNAVVRPENRFTLRGLRRDRHAGTAIQKLFVSNPGRISVAGHDVRHDVTSIRRAGATTLDLAATGAKERKLSKRGTIKLKPTFTFKPLGGTARQTRATVKLKRR